MTVATKGSFTNDVVQTERHAQDDEQPAMEQRKVGRGREPGKSRSAVSRRRKREGLELVWLPRSVLTDAALAANAIGAWDIENEEEVRKALQRYMIDFYKKSNL